MDNKRIDERESIYTRWTWKLMIDSHTHSKYSKHAVGEIEEVVISAIKNNVKILTITDHAPFN